MTATTEKPRTDKSGESVVTNIESEKFYFEVELKKIDGGPSSVRGYLTTSDSNRCLDELAGDEIFKNLSPSQIFLYSGESDHDSKHYVSSRDVDEIVEKSVGEASYEIISYRNKYLRGRSQVIFNGNRS
tara:strand:- start:170 stop:556 length:387 start_codon:yes stop_codon:yes gene_type:complete